MLLVLPVHALPQRMPTSVPSLALHPLGSGLVELLITRLPSPQPGRDEQLISTATCSMQATQPQEEAERDMPLILRLSIECHSTRSGLMCIQVEQQCS